MNPETMEVVRRILATLAAGGTVKGAQRELEQGAVPAPGVGPRWSAATIRNIALQDVYRPHSHEELAGLVPADVLARLDPERQYGIAWAGQRRTSFKPGGSKRRVAEGTPREEWIGVPIDLGESGLERAVVDRARAVIENNRKSSKVSGHPYELSGSILRCGGCGRAMQAYRRKRASGGYVHYYRCRRSTTLNVCPNRKSHRALELEHEAVWMFQQYASMDTLLELYDRAVEEEEKRTGLRGSLERRDSLSESLGVLAKMRRGFQDQQAEDLMTRPELRERLAELDEEKEQVAAGLRAVEDASSTARRIESA